MSQSPWLLVLSAGCVLQNLFSQDDKDGHQEHNAVICQLSEGSRAIQFPFPDCFKIKKSVDIGLGGVTMIFEWFSHLFSNWPLVQLENTEWSLQEGGKAVVDRREKFAGCLKMGAVSRD